MKSSRLRNRTSRRASEVKDEELIQQRHFERLAIASQIAAHEEWIGGDPNHLAANLRALCRRSTTKQKDIAAQIGATNQWLRSRCKYGVSKVTTKNRDRFVRLASFFGVALADLWNPNCLSNRIELVPPESVYVDEIRQCHDLLDSGCFPWLPQLLRILHDSWMQDGAKILKSNKPNPRESYRRRLDELDYCLNLPKPDTADTSE